MKNVKLNNLQYKKYNFNEIKSKTLDFDRHIAIDSTKFKCTGQLSNTKEFQSRTQSVSDSCQNILCL